MKLSNLSDKEKIILTGVGLTALGATVGAASGSVIGELASRVPTYAYVIILIFALLILIIFVIQYKLRLRVARKNGNSIGEHK